MPCGDGARSEILRRSASGTKCGARDVNVRSTMNHLGSLGSDFYHACFVRDEMIIVCERWDSLGRSTDVIFGRQFVRLIVMVTRDGFRHTSPMP